MAQSHGIPSLSPSRHARLPRTTSVSTQGVDQSMQNTLPFQSAQVNNTSNMLPTSNIFNNMWSTNGILQGILNRDTNNSSHASNIDTLQSLNNHILPVQNTYQPSFQPQTNSFMPQQSSLALGNQFNNYFNNGAHNNFSTNMIFPPLITSLNNGMQQIQQGMDIYSIVYCVLCALCRNVYCILPSQTNYFRPSIIHDYYISIRPSCILQFIDAKLMWYGWHDHSSPEE